MVALPQPRAESISAPGWLRLGFRYDFPGDVRNRRAVFVDALQASKAGRRNQISEITVDCYGCRGRVSVRRAADLSVSLVGAARVVIVHFFSRPNQCFARLAVGYEQPGP